MAHSFGKHEELAARVVGESFLSEFPVAATARLLSGARLIEVPANSVVYREYETPFVGLILSGLAKAFIKSKDGKQLTVKHAGPGDFLGLPALLGGAVPVCIESLSPCIALRLDSAALEHLGKNEPGFGWRIAQEVGDDFCDLLVGLGENVFDSMLIRLAKQLLFLAAEDPSAPRIKVSQRELAESIGSVREVVSRSLRKLKAEGLVEIGGDGILVLDAKRLKAFLDRD